MDNTNAERQRRYIARLKARAAAADGVSNAKLEAELAALKAENARLKAELERERRQVVGKPKSAKPPLSPDEERDRQIKALKTRVRNLTAELYHTREWHKQKADGSMSFQTMSAIAKALHPDQQPSEAQRAEACKLFTAWKGDRDAARRKAKG